MFDKLKEAKKEKELNRQKIELLKLVMSEDTIKAIGELARVGMCETDKEIIHLMIDK